MEENIIVRRDSRPFSFNFDWPKNVDEYLKHEVEFFRKSNESFAENKIKARLNNYYSNRWKQ